MLKAAVQLQRRVTELEHEVQETRKLNRRVAELTDLVFELLVVAGESNPEVEEIVERYRESL